MRLSWLWLALLSVVAAIRDPYETLRIRKTASQRDVKRAYKALAKEWHPDKSAHPNAAEKFMEINQAYEILSDPEKRRRYDQFGETGDEPQGRQRNPHFDDFFSDFPFANFGGQNFKYNSANSFFAKHRISLREYEGRLLDESWRKPFLLFAYADWCMSCHQAEPVWEKIVGDVEPIGFGVGTANAMLDGGLVRHMRVQALPALIVLFEARTFHYRGPISYSGVIKFARDLLPKHHVQSVSDENVAAFLDSWRQNKVSVLLFGNKEESRLRYLLAAIKFQAFARFGYAQFGSKSTKIRQLLGLGSREGETVLVFNERPEAGPIARLSAKEISAEALEALVEEHKWLALPRLSSQAHLDALCPPSLSARSRRLCAVLVVSSPEDSTHIEAFRDLVDGASLRKPSLTAEKLRFLYMFAGKQEPFLKALQISPAAASGSLEKDHRDVVVLWRTGAGKAKYEWLREAFNGHPDYANASGDALLGRLEALVKGRESLSKDAALASLVDEYGPGLYTRFARRVMRAWEQLVYHLTKDEFLPAISVLGTIGVIVLLGYCLNYASLAEQRREKEERLASERLLRKRPTTDAASHASSATSGKSQGAWMKILRELRAETYFGMIRLLKPGCRTIVVVVDEERKAELCRDFARAVWPWRNNKTLYFGFLVVPKNLAWFRAILEYTLPSLEDEEEAGEGRRSGDEGEGSTTASIDPRLRNINPKQVVGTVLALNGWRLYFSMYHPKHAPSMEGYRRPKSSTAAKSLGLDSDESSSEEERELSRKANLETHELLAGLPNWLERLFEGQGRRYHLPAWPELK